MKSLKYWTKYLWTEWIRPILPIVLIVIPLRSSIADYNPVPTGSMTPTILEGDLVFVNKIAYDLRIPLTRWRIYRWSQPVKGDMVVCFSPEDHKRLVKRVIGEPGDIITMKRGVLWINGESLKYKKIENPYIEDLDSDLLQTSLFALEYLGQQRQ